MAKNEALDEETDKRELRRKRRVKNQIIAYVVLAVILIGIIAGGTVLADKIISALKDKKQAEELQKQLEELAGTEGEPPVVEAPVESADPIGESDYLGEAVESIIAGMPLEAKVAGLFIITPEALTDMDTVIRAGDTTRDKLGEHPVGGLIYFAKNIQDAAQLTEMLQNTRSFNKSIFLAVDEEGGTVCRVAGKGLAEDVGSMADIGATGNPSAAQEAGAAIGGYLSGYGFNLDFAPVADVVSEGNQTIGSRSFGSDPELVASMVAAAVEGLQSSGVSACLKHFPGLGDTQEDTHNGMASTQKSLEDFNRIDFPVYQAGINAGVDMIMVSHLSAPGVTGDNTPASLSEKMITEILRGQLGYQGIVITDSMSMGAVTDYYTADEAAVKALSAGADMILMPEDYETAYNGVLEAVNNGTLSEERINESLRRIFMVKEKNAVE